MKGKFIIVGCLALALCLTPIAIWSPGCSIGGDFLGLEDYQRDLLVGGLAVAILSNATGGGVDCWDLNGNGVNDPVEDVNGDGAFNALDCIAGAGQPTPTNGISCWDLNENGVADPEEDTNGDGSIDVNDCQGSSGSGGTGSTGADGLACWDLDGDGIKDPSEDRNLDGVFDARDCQGANGANGGPGATGPAGADGPNFFDVWIDDFFALDFISEGINPFLPVFVVRIDEPVLSFPEESPIAYRVAIPPSYTAGNDVTMRLFFYRTGFSDGNCFVMSLDSRRLRNGTGTEVYGDNCTGDAPVDCGRRWIRIHEVSGIAGEVESNGVLIVVDLPLNTVTGLNLERDLSGADRLAPGDFLAFEINKSNKSDDSRNYQILGVEFFESSPGTASLVGASSFDSSDADVCGLFDCQPNGIIDEVDIAECPQDDPGCQDCNGNQIPDECDIRDCPAEDASCQDCNENGIPDGCELCEVGDGELTAAGNIAGTSPPFPFLMAGFTQELYASSPGFMGGVAFAPDNDVLVTACVASGSSLRRFDAQSTVLVNGSTIHPLSATLSSNGGCGITNHPNGTLYTNTSGGLVNLDADTGVQIGTAVGQAGNALGITVDPQTGDIVYVAEDCRFTTTCTLVAVNPDTGMSHIFAELGVKDATFVDGIFFDPTGDFLFLAVRNPENAIGILDRDGGVVQIIPISSEPDGIAFHASDPKFVVTVNTDGTMTRLDFAGNDFTTVPTLSTFASGGFRGDLSQVGADGCLYLTQDGTRFADGTESQANSIVRICGEFNPPIPGAIQLTPQTAFGFVGDTHTVISTARTDAGDPIEGAVVTFDVFMGPNAGDTGTGTTNVNGEATFTYTGDGGVGTDQVQATFEDEGTTQFSNIVTIEWLPIDCATDCNLNGVPDECELIDNDCNQNGVPDDCDGGCAECEIDEDCDDQDPCTVDACDFECFHHPVCDGGLICQEGQCFECLVDEDCDQGFFCIEGICELD